jgi:hypothetical protein
LKERFGSHRKEGSRKMADDSMTVAGIDVAAAVEPVEGAAIAPIGKMAPAA